MLAFFDNTYFTVCGIMPGVMIEAMTMAMVIITGIWSYLSAFVCLASYKSCPMMSLLGKRDGNMDDKYVSKSAYHRNRALLYCTLRKHDSQKP